MAKSLPDRRPSDPPAPSAAPAATESEARSVVEQVLRETTKVVVRHPRLAVVLSVLAAIACVAATALFLRFKTERADLISPDAAFHQRWLSYAKNFGSTSDIVAVVESDSPATVQAVLDDLGPRVAADREHFADVLWKVDASRLRSKGLQYLSPEQLAGGLDHLQQFGPVLRHSQWQLLDLDATFAGLLRRAEGTTRAPNGGDLRPLIAQAGLLATSMETFLAPPHEFRSPWPDVVPVDPRMKSTVGQTHYLTNDRGTIGFLRVRPVAGQGGGFDGAAESISRLRDMAKEVAARHEGARVALTGIPVLEHDEMRLSQTDMTRASVLSFVGVAVLMFVGFRGFKHPLLALATLAVGMAWSFGFTTASVGHLNILSVSFAAILVGLGIDFGIHFLSRYLELRHEGHQLRPALLETSSTLGVGLVAAAVTTGLAFLCAAFTPFLGIAELGIIAGGGIVLCLAAVFLVLPALIALADANAAPQKLPVQLPMSWLRNAIARFPRTFLIASAVPLVALAVQVVGWQDGKPAWRVRYDHNLLNLQADGLESVEVQKRIFQDAQGSVLFAVSLADGPAEARALKAKFEALPTVDRVEELGSRLPAHPHADTALLVQAFRSQVARLPEKLPESGPVDPFAVGRAMEQFYRFVRNRKEPGAAETARALDRVLDAFERLPLATQAAFVRAYQNRFRQSLLEQLHLLRDVSDPEPLVLADIPPELLSRFVSQEGKWLVQIHPKEEIWDLEPLSRFVADVRSVDPNVTGTPLQNFEASRQIRESYEKAGAYAFAMICAVLLVDFLRRRTLLVVLFSAGAIVGTAVLLWQARRAPIDPALIGLAFVAVAALVAAVADFRNVRDMLLSLLPPALGMLVTFGTMVLLKVDLNPANLIVLPLLLGIGIDNGIHVLHDCRGQPGEYRISGSTINAIVLTSTTTMIGFGSMMISDHRGLFSFGLVLTIGVASCLFVSLVLLPAALTVLCGRQATPAAGSAAAPLAVGRHAA